MNSDETEKEFYSCICMTCGVRNDHSAENGYCQNGHDNWLEYADVYHETPWFFETAKKFNLMPEELVLKFKDKNVSQL